jgi:acetyltransferase-like isoleucine patch superfamily enzyme
MKKVAVFGACREGVEVYRSLYASSIIGQQEIHFNFLDNDSRLSGSTYEGVPVYSPYEADLSSYEMIVVGIIAFERVQEQLISLQVPSEKIVRYYSDAYYSDKARRVGMAKIGKYSYFKPSTVLYNVEIGNYCHIGADCRLGLIGHDVSQLTTYPFGYQFGKNKENYDCSKDVTSDLKKMNTLKIGHDVYIGEGVTIMSGIEIGIGAVIGSKSVVTKDVPPFTVFAGTPAKMIAERLSPIQQQALLDSKWWEHDKEAAASILEAIAHS